jgi:hypothetical protein
MAGAELGTFGKNQIENIGIAADLLRRLMWQLQCLQINNSRLALVIATAGHELGEPLHALQEMVALLGAVNEPCIEEELSDKAVALIHRLAGELGPLAYAAEVDYKRASPAR